MHQVCTSVFLQDDWITYLASLLDQAAWPDDFRSHRTVFLSKHCAYSANRPRLRFLTVVLQYYSSNYVTALAIINQIYCGLNRRRIDQTVHLVHHQQLLVITRADTWYHTSKQLSYPPTWSNYLLFVPSGSEYVNSGWFVYDDNCSCATSSSCALAIKNLWEQLSLITVVCARFLPWMLFLRSTTSIPPRMFVQSNLFEPVAVLLGFHDATEHQSSRLIGFWSLLSEHDQSNRVLEQLLVDKWNWTITHDDYYASCQPTACTYTISS